MSSASVRPKYNSDRTIPVKNSRNNCLGVNLTFICPYSLLLTNKKNNGIKFLKNYHLIILFVNSNCIKYMSYSYIKSVFPNFKEQEIELPQTAPPVTHKPQPPESPLLAYNDQELTLFVKNLLQKSNNITAKPPNAIEVGQVDNRRFTQPPIPQEYLQSGSTTNISGANNGSSSGRLRLGRSNVESFGNELMGGDYNHYYNSYYNQRSAREQNHCDSYIEHCLSCEKCRTLMVKELNLKRYNKQQDFIETIMYILFAILILLLLNNLKRQ